MCGKKLDRILLALSLLLALSSPIYSDDDLPAWVDNMTETEAKTALVESVMRLETTTNELDISLNLNDAWKTWSVRESELLDNAMSLNRELIAERKADAERFQRIENSFNDYEVQTQKAIQINRWTGRAEGAGVGAILTLLLVLFL